MEEEEEEVEDAVVDLFSSLDSSTQDHRRNCIHNKQGAEQKPSKVAN